MANSCTCGIYPEEQMRYWEVACSCDNSGGGDLDNYYTKVQTDARIQGAKADVEADIEELARDVEEIATDIADTYDKQEVDTKLSLKANITDTYNKDSVDAMLATKASTATTTDLQNQINNKQDTLVSGVNIKKLNGESILGSGNIVITGGTVDAYTKAETDALLADKQDASGMSGYATNATVATKADITALTAVNGVLTAHTSDTVVHTSSAEKNTWNTVTGKADNTAVTALNTVVTAHTANTEIHTTAAEKATWGTVTGKADTTALTAVNNDLTGHTADTTVHTNSTEKTAWNGAATNATQALTQLNGYTITAMTKAQFDALTVKDPQTIYFVKD